MSRRIKGASAPTGNILQRYQRESEAREFTAASGYVFVVKGALREEYGEIMGGIPSLLKPSGRPADQKELTARQEAIYRAIFEKYVVGLKDPETGEVVPISYDMVLTNDVPEVCEFALARGGMGSEKAAQIARSL